MIKLKQASVTFNANTPLVCHALKGIDLDIPKGQFVTLIGSNGAGKSTLLNMIAGDVIPETGDIKIDQVDVTCLSSEKRAPWIARVFQDPLMGSCEDLSIEENLALAYKRGEKRGWKKALYRHIQEEFRQQLAQLKLGLENRLQEPMKSLSGGQRQCVSLLMTTLKPMKILLLDEHTAALDPKNAEYVLGLTQKLITEHHLTVLMVTHSMKQALDYGDRIIMLHEGKIVIDLKGRDRKGLVVADLMALFAKDRSQVLSDDTLLL